MLFPIINKNNPPTNVEKIKASFEYLAFSFFLDNSKLDAISIPIGKLCNPIPIAMNKPDAKLSFAMIYKLIPSKILCKTRETERMTPI